MTATLGSQSGPWAAVPRWVYTRMAGNPWAVMVYTYLADHADRHDDSWTCSRQMIADGIGTSTSTVDRVIPQLVDAGALVVQRRWAGDRWAWSRYVVMLIENPAGGVEVDEVNPAGDDEVNPAGDDIFQEPLIKNPSMRSTSAEGEELFVRFYNAYPRKKQPAAARRAFKSALKRDGIEPIRAGLKLSLREWQGRAIDKIPYPASWLNSGEYLSEPDAAPDGVHRNAGKVMQGPGDIWYRVNDDGTETEVPAP